MRIEYINPFIESSRTVLEEILQSKVKSIGMKLKENSSSAKGVSAIVGLAGCVEGRIIFDMEIDTAVNIISAMLKSMGMESVVELDELGKSSLTELANMITGRAITKISDLGFVFDITPPALFTGEKMNFSGESLEVFSTSLELENIGLLELNILIKDRV